MRSIYTFEQIAQTIRRYAHAMIESRQVAQRLRRLIPDHLKSFQKKMSSLGAGSASRALRCALTNQDYLNHLDELVEVSYHADAARIQYETHMMLLQAKRSLRHSQYSKIQKVTHRP